MGKIKKKKGFSHPRSDWVYAQINHPTSSFSVTVDPANGTVMVNEAEPASVHVVRSYESASGKERCVISTPFNSLEAPLSASQALQNQFNVFIAIDTSKKVIDGRTMCATVAYGVDAYAHNEVIRPLAGFLIFDVEANVNPEKIGWHLALRGVNAKYFQSNKKLGVVVDSALEEHQEINARKIGYYEENYLPDFASLIYASDRSADDLPNQMIRLCDAQAAKVLNQLTPDAIKQFVLEKGDKNFAGFASLKFRTDAPNSLYK